MARRPVHERNPLGRRRRGYQHTENRSAGEWPDVDEGERAEAIEPLTAACPYPGQGLFVPVLRKDGGGDVTSWSGFWASWALLCSVC